VKSNQDKSKPREQDPLTIHSNNLPRRLKLVREDGTIKSYVLLPAKKGKGMQLV